MARRAASDTSKTRRFYDRIAEVQNFAMKVNGYRTSVARYLRSVDLGLDGDSVVLDAGSGTGLVTMAFLDAGIPHRSVCSLDLSLNSLSVAREVMRRKLKNAGEVLSIQGNVLSLPFADSAFDLVLMCGVLEYVRLDLGLAEVARVMRSGARLVLLPVKPSLVGSVLELLYNFKTHKLDDVAAAAGEHFSLVERHRFPISEPISWSKAGLLLERR